MGNSLTSSTVADGQEKHRENGNRENIHAVFTGKLQQPSDSTGPVLTPNSETLCSDWYWRFISCTKEGEKKSDIIWQRQITPKIQLLAVAREAELPEQGNAASMIILSHH